MVAIAQFFVALVFASFAIASPVQVHGTRATSVSSTTDHLAFPSTSKALDELLCLIPLVEKLTKLCTRSTSTSSSSGTTVSTPLGTATGAATSSGVKFAVKYASANRWEDSSVVTTWALPNGNTDPSTSPLICPQSGVDASTYSEDCLSMILYVPSTVLKSGGNVPTMMWIHGGSFIEGSATQAGIDGTNLAEATGSIVAVIQYRLGALGWNAPSGKTNLALGDTINALKFLQKVVPSFGGSASKITVAGQSAGANMIRALLATPSADSLFQSAILQSDPIDYGFLSTTTQTTLQNYFNSLLNCSSTDTTCLNNLSVSTILDASSNLFSEANSLDLSANQAEPLRPVHDGTLITTPLDLTATFPSVSKPIILSNVKNEAGLEIFGNFDSTMASSFYDEVVEATFTTRTDTVLSASEYTVPVLADGEEADARTTLETLGTDQIWRCATWTLARLWSQNGGKAYVGQYVVGATYPGNEAVSFCTEDGSVCHQDDIEIVFGTVSSPTSAQSALITEMQARYKAFLNTGNPNPSGSSYATWNAATSASDVSALLLGGTGTEAVGACTVDFWGDELQYDYQVFGI